MLFNSVRITEIAKKANVSTATVSRVINHPSSVSAETKRIVEDAMESLGVTKEIQMSFSKAKKQAEDLPQGKIILVNLPSIGNPFFSDVLKGIESSVTSRGLTILIYTGLINNYSLQNVISLIESTNTVGIISLVKIPSDAIKILSEIVSIVQCSEYDDNFLTSYVGIDERSAARQATEHIISTGHKKIALFNTSLQNIFARHRQEGFLEALYNANISIPDNWIVNLPNLEYRTAHPAITQILSSDNTPDALFAVSDVFAVAALNVARDLGYSVPDDLIVVGFDDINLSLMSYPTITTVSQPRYQIGYTAGELLFEKINNPDQPPRDILFNTELIVRGSSILSNSTKTVIKRAP